MLPKLQYYATQWVDGMKVTEGHLVNQENFFADQLRDHLALHLTDFNYGLAPASPQHPSLEIEVNAEWIEVNACRAVTAGGRRIEVWPGEAKELRMPTRQLVGNGPIPDASAWYVVLKVNPFERVPAGVVNPQESPLRHPHARPAYALDVIPADRVAPAEFGSAQLPVAKIQGSRGGLKVVEEYIPPCMRTDSHPDLLRHHREFGNRLQRMHEEAFEVVDHLRQQRAAEGTLNPLAQDIGRLTEQLVLFLAAHRDAYRLSLPQQAPLAMIELFVRFARTLHSTLRLLHDRETFYEYCRKYLTITPGEWDLPLTDLTYNHLEIKESLDQVSAFLDLVEGRFLRKLSGLRTYTLTPEKTVDYDPIRQVRVPVAPADAPDRPETPRKAAEGFWSKSLRSFSIL